MQARNHLNVGINTGPVRTVGVLEENKGPAKKNLIFVIFF